LLEEAFLVKRGTERFSPSSSLSWQIIDFMGWDEEACGLVDTQENQREINTKMQKDCPLCKGTHLLRFPWSPLT
jgi:hypothetical protein